MLLELNLLKLNHNYGGVFMFNFRFKKNFSKLKKSFINKDYKKSIEYANYILKDYPNNIDVLKYKYNALSELKDYKNALICIDYILNLETSYRALMNKGTTLCLLKRYDEGFLIFDEVINSKDKSIEKFIMAGGYYGELFLEEEIYKIAFMNKSHFLYELKRFDEIINLANIMIDLDSSFANAYDVKSSAYIAKSDWKNALNCVNQALDLKPKEELYIERKKYIINKMDDL